MIIWLLSNSIALRAFLKGLIRGDSWKTGKKYRLIFGSDSLNSIMLCGFTRWLICIFEGLFHVIIDDKGAVEKVFNSIRYYILKEKIISLGVYNIN